jgi:amphiphysin
VVISEWESFFQPIQHEVETGLKIIAQGKAITKPMNSIHEEKSLRSRLPSLPNIPGRGKKAPPPPPPGSATSLKLEDRERPSVRSQRSSTSIHTKLSRNESSPPPMPRVHPPIGGIKGKSASFPGAERDESPPPPLPGPRPTEASSRPSPSRSYTNGSATATPLAGLKPGMFRSNGSIPTQSSLRATPRKQNDNAPPPYVASRSDLITVVAGKKKPPPPPPKKKFSSGPKEDWVRAIFDYQGQPGEGDLSFKEGDRILVIKRTDSTDGKLRTG